MPATLVEDRLGIGGQDRVRPEGPDLADELFAQGEVVGQGAVRLVQEGDPGITDDRRGGPLLGLAQRGQLERVGVGVLAALVAARAADQPALGARIDPARGGAGRPEVGVVGVGGDDHEAGRAPGVVDRVARRRSAAPCRSRGRRVGRPAKRPVTTAAAAWSSSSTRRTSLAWPSGLTLGQTRAMRPSGPIRKVVRATPQ